MPAFPRIRQFWIAPALFALILIAWQPSFETIVVSVIIAPFLMGIQFSIQYIILLHLRSKNGFLKNEKRFAKSILALAAAAVKADGAISPLETQVIHRQIRKNFNEKDAAEFIVFFDACLDKTIDVKAICKVIHAEFDDATKTHLIYLLVQVLAVDGILTDEEIDFMERLTRWAHLPIPELISILNLVNVKRESHRQKKAYSSTSSSSGYRSTKASLERAYTILGIDKTADETAIKKAYRKLAKLHHPDRVIHLGTEYQEKAKEKFQEISDAYELIKTQKGFS